MVLNLEIGPVTTSLPVGDFYCQGLEQERLEMRLGVDLQVSFSIFLNSFNLKQDQYLISEGAGHFLSAL